ncbi:MAG: methyltransferase domain-containing protein [Nanoarchaeota archaeon]
MKLGKENNLLENTYNSRNLITKIYFRSKVMTAIKLANLKKEDIILDYGCGDGWLEHKLKNYKIYGYDLNPKKSFIKDYKKIKPTKIFALDVFEHIPIKEVKKIIKNFKKMGDFELIISQPTENFISRKIRKLVGKSEVPKEHITRYEDIVKLLIEEFKLTKKINFFSVCHIFLFNN